MTQAKPPGEKYVSRHFMLPPDIAAAIDRWPRGKRSQVVREALAKGLANEDIS